ncbi:MAG TPA: tetratricopeptide repeat protein [Flavobacterium sp.]|jgi:tetratricopeptide (TPR) repeat protein
MKKTFFYIAFLFSLSVFAQNEQLALNYFERGEFEKALASYEALSKLQPGNFVFFQKQTECLQQLSQFDKAEKNLAERYKIYKQPALLVEIGYNYQLQKKEDKAKDYYEQAIAKINENPDNVYQVAINFEKKIVLNYALKAYETALKKEPKYNFNYQMAMLHGQLGNTDLMIEKFLNESQSNPETLVMIQNQLSRYMTDEGSEKFNQSLRKALLIRAQKEQDILWAHYLSWFFVQQKEYAKAFIQEKAIFKRNPESLYNIVNLGQLAKEEKETETAREIFTFVLNNTQDKEMQLQIHTALMTLKIESAPEKEYPLLTGELEKLVADFGVNPYSVNLQILQAHFLTFNLKQPEKAIAILKQTQQLPLIIYQQAKVTMELADIFLFHEKYNQALLYYSQIEESLKNNEIGHEASLKAAKTSYFKGDFDWALQQFKVLKSASSQLIANDALEYFLLINDNTVADSTRTALKKLSRGDYLLYQNKFTEALAQFSAIVKEHKGEEIESVTLYKLGNTYEKLGDFTSALSQYQKIIDHHNESIYIDEALYFSAEIYNKQLKDTDKAKALYEKILFKHEDSIYFIDSRKKFRELRGDTNL